MRCLIVGLGTQGKKRLAVAGPEVVATVDPVTTPSLLLTRGREDLAHHAAIEQVPLPDYDAALVCTPDGAKPDLLRYLLSRGKHVLVEKPLLAADERPLRDLLALAQANRVTCYTAYNHRFEPHIVRLKELLDSQILGSIYLVRMFYGNGTARDVRGSPWRDQGLGVLPDLGSHLLDWVLYLFGKPSVPFRPWSWHCFENRSFDHFVFGSSGQPTLELEVTLLSWRNTCTLDVYGERGSAHLDCLCKWGPSRLTVRQRMLPSGRPVEEVQVLERPDPTWDLEYQHFKQRCRTGESNLENDLWINSVLNHLARDIGMRAAA
jgi:predicted dehydrogenase